MLLRVGIGLTTIENWLKTGTFPERKPREQSSQRDPYRPSVQERWSQGYHNLMGIYRELQAQGYQGSYENVRAQFVDASPRSRVKQALAASQVPPLPSKRHASWLFLRRPEDLTLEEQGTVMRLRHLHSDVDQAYLFVQQFVAMLRTRTGEKLDDWLLAVTSSPLVDLQSFNDRLHQELVPHHLQNKHQGNALQEDRGNREDLLKEKTRKFLSSRCSSSIGRSCPPSLNRCYASLIRRA